MTTPTLAGLKAEAVAFLAASNRTTEEGADSYYAYRKTVESIYAEYGDTQGYLVERELEEGR